MALLFWSRNFRRAHGTVRAPTQPPTNQRASEKLNGKRKCVSVFIVGRRLNAWYVLCCYQYALSACWRAKQKRWGLRIGMLAYLWACLLALVSDTPATKSGRGQWVKLKLGANALPRRWLSLAFPPFLYFIFCFYFQHFSPQHNWKQ